MPSQPSLAGSLSSQPVRPAREQIEQLVRERLLGRKVDGVRFMDELLAVAAQVDAVCCRPVGDHALCFDLSAGESFEVEVDANRGKLRMLCARLAVLCQENGHDFMPFGGAGTIGRECVSATWGARWINTPGQHEFCIRVVR